ncbi:MAG: DUF3703 domain-containing protein [Deltaproteobacteria bacterium]|nr:DUF3703 domain-containing protein [Deltaproteobacteria bacterium]
MEADVTSSTLSKAQLRAGLSRLIAQGLEAARRTPAEEAWRHLERGHILSQPFAGLHVKVHVHMIRRAFRDRNWRELVGQLPRLVLAGPGSLLGRYPRGNRGTTTISMFRPEPMPSDLASLLSEDPKDTERSSEEPAAR